MCIRTTARPTSREFSISETGGSTASPATRPARRLGPRLLLGSWDGILHYNGMPTLAAAGWFRLWCAFRRRVKSLRRGSSPANSAMRCKKGGARSRYDDRPGRSEPDPACGVSGIDVDAMARRVIAASSATATRRKRRLARTTTCATRGTRSFSCGFELDLHGHRCMARAVIRGRLRQRRGAQATPRLLLLDRAVARERDAVMRRRLAFIADQVGWLLGDVACFLLLILFLPLVPVFKMFEGIRDRHED